MADLEQQGDILVSQTADDGEFNIEDGITEMTPGLGNFAYLCMFGGNEDDSGAQNDSNEYWGNLLESSPEKHYRSETQYLLGVLPVTTGNLQRLRRAAERDLKPMIDVGAATTITVEVSLITYNSVEFVIGIEGEQSLTLIFTENWLASL
jgi:hypothetical protein